MAQKPQKAAVIYCRISKDEKGTFQGVGRQKEDCLQLAKERGFTVSGIYVDNDISAYSGAVRPEYRRLLAELPQLNPAAIIAWHTDRLHRHPRELEEYIDFTEKHGATTLTVKAGDLDLSTPSGRAVARTLGAWARFESEHKSDRIQRKKLQLAKDGKYVGGPIPFGYQRLPGEGLSLHPTEAPEVAEVFRKFLAGASIGSLVRDFNERDIKSRRGLPWNSTTMRNLLLRATYAGKATHRGEIVGDAEAPAIVTESDWLAAGRILNDPARRRNVESKVKHLLAGLIHCGHCGAPMKSSSRSSKTQITNKIYYKCPTRGYGHSFQTAEPIDAMVRELVIERLSDPEARQALASPEDPKRAAELQTQLLVLRGRLDDAASSYAQGLITGSQLATISGSIRAQQATAEDELAALSVGSAVPALEEGDITAWWDNAPLESRRAVIDALMTITIKAVKVAAPRRFDPQRVQVDWKR